MQIIANKTSTPPLPCDFQFIANWNLLWIIAISMHSICRNSYKPSEFCQHLGTEMKPLAEILSYIIAKGHKPNCKYCSKQVCFFVLVLVGNISKRGEKILCLTEPCMHRQFSHQMSTDWLAINCGNTTEKASSRSSSRVGGTF